MKKLYLFMILLLLVSPLLMAAGSHTIKVRGTIEEINATAMTITVDGTLIQVTIETEIAIYTDEGCVDYSFNLLAVGDRVNVICKLVGDVLVARTIIVH